MQRFDLYLADIQIKKLNAISKKTLLAVAELSRRIIDGGLVNYEDKLNKYTL